MRVHELRAQYKGLDIPVAFAGDGWLAFARRDVESVYQAVDELDPTPDATWVKIAEGKVDRFYEVRVDATWRGAQVSVEGMGEDGSEVNVYSLAGPSFAALNGLTGDQHNGWYGVVPVAELQDVQETEIDLL